jgi:hypothetical protein
MAAESEPARPLSPVDLENVGTEDFLGIVDALAASLMPPPTPATPDLWTSPGFSDFGGDFSFSPDGDADPLNTPVVGDYGDDMMTGMFFPDSEGDLFPAMDYAEYTYEKPVLPAPLPDTLYTLTPESPALHDFSPSINPSSIYPSPRLPSSFPSPAPSTASGSRLKSSVPLSALPERMTIEADLPNRRRSSATGTRKGVTPEALVPIDAPTQPRKYVIPSATSRKEVPSVFAKKRSRSTAFGEEDDDFNEPPLPPDATEKEQIEYKRRQNTVAARRSRKRKLQYQQDLEEKVERLSRERDVWKTRAIMCQDMLVANGVQFSGFQDSIED